MWPAERICPGGERRFLALLAVSAALHALALAWVRMPEAPRPGAPAMLAVLNASLRVGGVVPEREVAPSRPAPPPVVQTAARQPSTRRASRALPAAPEVAGPTAAPSAAPSVEAAAAVAEPTTPAAPTPIAAPPPAPPAADAARLLDDYGQRLADLFSRQQEYPRLAALRGWEGEVRVRLSVARRGNLTAVRLERSSGYEVLDRHALAMVEAIGQLPPPPAGFIESSPTGDVQVVVPVHYKLRKPV